MRIREIAKEYDDSVSRNMLAYANELDGEAAAEEAERSDTKG
ncbi:MAG: hypothetical protein V4530_01880 [Pseudomonadota bacterium]